MTPASIPEAATEGGGEAAQKETLSAVSLSQLRLQQPIWNATSRAHVYSRWTLHLHDRWCSAAQIRKMIHCNQNDKTHNHSYSCKDSAISGQCWRRDKCLRSGFPPPALCTMLDLRWISPSIVISCLVLFLVFRHIAKMALTYSAIVENKTFHNKVYSDIYAIN